MYLILLLTLFVARYKQIWDQSLALNMRHFLLGQGLLGCPGLVAIPHNNLFIALTVPDMNSFRLAVRPVPVGGENTDRVVGLHGSD